ncbi:MAG: hypothetical protein GY883_23780 [Shimia sp.]|nr:hypothetical protein [Shimia sp.]
MSDLQRLLRELVTQILTEELGQAIKAQPTPTLQAPAAIQSPANASVFEHEVSEGLLSERMVKTLSAAGHKTLTLGPQVVITPLAREAARFTGMTLKTLDRR